MTSFHVLFVFLFHSPPSTMSLFIAIILIFLLCQFCLEFVSSITDEMINNDKLLGKERTILDLENQFLLFLECLQLGFIMLSS
jgi:hypothetical protein